MHDVGGFADVPESKTTMPETSEYRYKNGTTQGCEVYITTLNRLKGRPWVKVWRCVVFGQERVRMSTRVYENELRRLAVARFDAFFSATRVQPTPRREWVITHHPIC